MQNHFDLFHLPQKFSIDMNTLEGTYREVQGQVHPDKFVGASDTEKRVAMQWATRTNEAYQILKNPLKRATYLCQLNGVDLQTESNTAMPVPFLMQQMEWREALEDARAVKNTDALEALDTELQSMRQLKIEKIAAYLDAHDFVAAAQEVRALMFVEKFGEEVHFAFDELEL